MRLRRRSLNNMSEKPVYGLESLKIGDKANDGETSKIEYGDEFVTLECNGVKFGAFISDQDPDPFEHINKVIQAKNDKAQQWLGEFNISGKFNIKTMEQKTIKEWFETLPEPIRSQAMENTDDETLKIKESALHMAIQGAFAWYKTSEQGQGWEYWNHIQARSQSGEFNTK